MLKNVPEQENGRERIALERVERAVPPDLRQGLQILLAQSADPHAVLLRTEIFCDRHPDRFQHIASIPFGLQSLLAVFSSSEFLSDDVLQYPDWLLTILESGWLHRVRTHVEMMAELESWLTTADGVPKPVRMASFRRRQILRIMLRDVLGFAALSEITDEISNVADALLDVTYRRLRLDLIARHGTPRLPNGEECGFSVLGLGKLGANELNYSSDIDLIFFYEGDGQTDGENPISNREFFKKISTRLTDLLGTHTPEGFCYRVDLRLRPDGRLGEVCISVDAAKKYYAERSRDWELQMLIKARVVAGERGPGSAFLEWVQPMIYSTTVDFLAIEAMSETRERINEKLSARRRATGLDIKLSRGGIRDIEFLVQCLQRVHGGRAAWLRNSATLMALVRLRDKDLLSDSEYSRLASAYLFLRNLEHRLQFAADRQTHTLPDRPDQLDLFARRMPLPLMNGNPTGGELRRLVNLHLEQVHEIYQRVVHAQQPIYYTQQALTPNPLADASPLADSPAEEERFQAGASNLIRFLDQRAPGLAAVVARARLGGSQAAFEHFLEHVLKRNDWLKALDEDAVLAGYLCDVFQHSPHFAEHLVRTPEYFEELRSLRARGPSSTPYGEVMPLLEDIREVRRYYLQQMFRVQCESICLSTPVFDTLERTSQLADAAIAACYRIAIAQTLAVRGPETPGYQPSTQMMVIALGRLGMQEFDLGSDADLVFVLPDEDLPELHFWTRVAEKMVALLGSYTGIGTMFAVDTRLCPNGKGGALVQSESAYRDYFSSKAEAWEGIAYMKTRAIAGDTERATAFLEEIQKIDWRRYGQGGRSRKELMQMRMRLEKEQSAGNPLKTAAGGYYDIDFALMYLRLRGAGMFYKVLNTPRRIEVVEQMGHLDSSDAAFLRDAATFYRAVDHGLRIISGHSAGDLPTAETQLRLLTRLASRWMPEHLHDQPLAEELMQIQDRTRAFFNHLFGDQ